MPWSKGSAKSHTKAANTPKRQKAWSEIANKSLKSGYSESQAIKIANAAVKHVGKGKKK